MKGFVIVFLAVAVLLYNTTAYWWPFGKKGDVHVGNVPGQKADKKEAVKGKEEESAYDVETETLRYRLGREMICTEEGGEYEIGEVCAKGMVKAFRGNRIFIERPNGRALYVIAVAPRPKKNEETGYSGKYAIDKVAGL